MMSVVIIKINNSKNSEFEFLIFKTKAKFLQNFNEITHWNFPWYLIDLLSLILDISAARSEWITEYMRYVGIPTDSITSPSRESEHQFWNNPCSYENTR